jgi:hypothetical protein
MALVFRQGWLPGLFAPTPTSRGMTCARIYGRISGQEVLAPLSIIDTLSAGFSAVAKNLWLMAVPVVLDVGLWLAPKLSVAPVVDQLVTTMRNATQALGTTATADANVNQMVETLNTALQQSVGRTNLLSLLAWGRLGVPGVAGLRQIQPGADRIIEITGYGQWLGVQIVLLLVGLLITCVFLGMLGQAVRGEGVHLGKLSKRLPTYWLHMLAFMLPMGLLLFSVLGSSMILGALAFLLWGLLLWVIVYLAFVPQAITMSEEKPLKAVLSSFTVVRASFWSVLGLLILVNVISLGLGMMWPRLMGSNLGTVAAILLNAYVGTSLTAAYFIFFRERLADRQAAAKQPNR